MKIKRYGFDYRGDRIQQESGEYALYSDVKQIALENKQLEARVKALSEAIEKMVHDNATLEAEKEQCRMSERTLKEQCATLEQQLKDEKGICEALRSQNSDAVKEVQNLVQLIEEDEKIISKLYAETRCEECKHCIQKAKYDCPKIADGENCFEKTDIQKEKDQVCAKRDGGEKKE